MLIVLYSCLCLVYVSVLIVWVVLLSGMVVLLCDGVMCWYVSVCMVSVVVGIGWMVGVVMGVRGVSMVGLGCVLLVV